MARDRHDRARSRARYRPAVARACGIVLLATVAALLVLPFSVELLAVAALVAATALIMWIREQARNSSQRYRSATGASSGDSIDTGYGNAFDSGAAATFNTFDDDSRSCRFDSSYDSSSGSFDSGSSDSGSGDCGGSSGGD